MKFENFRWKILAAVGLVVSLFIVPQETRADFYKGKTITIIQAREPGGSGDMRVRAVMPFLRKYIPGNPNVVAEFMPGGGGRKAANHIYSTVRPDGLTIGNVGAGIVTNAILGQAGVNYDIDKFIYLGSGYSKTSYVFVSRKEAGLDTLEKLRAASGLRVGGQSVGHTIYVNARLFSWILPLKDAKFVTGYGGPDMDVALMQGEIDARANVTDTILERNRDLIEKGLVRFHVVLEVPKGYRTKHPLFDGLPALESLTRNDTQRRVLTMFRNFRLIGSPFLAPPGTPKEAADILKDAFRKVFNDREFLKHWQELTGAEATPLMPEEQVQAIQEIARDPETIGLFNKIAGPDPLPPS